MAEVWYVCAGVDDSHLGGSVGRVDTINAGRATARNVGRKKVVGVGGLGYLREPEPLQYSAPPPFGGGVEY